MDSQLRLVQQAEWSQHPQVRWFQGSKVCWFQGPQVLVSAVSAPSSPVVSAPSNLVVSAYPGQMVAELLPLLSVLSGYRYLCVWLAYTPTGPPEAAATTTAPTETEVAKF